MSLSRRNLLQAAAVLPALSLKRLHAQPAPSSITGTVKALIFDTFGSVVDWRGSIIAEGEAWGKTKGLKVDWAHFADRWREGYRPAMNKVRKGELPWTKLDALHRMILEQILPEFGITGLTEEEKDHWNRVWHRLKPWPDSVPGLARLKKKYTIAPLSNGNVALLLNMAKHSGLPWDMIFSAELARHYKPDPEAYQSVPALLRVRPGEVMLVAAHNGDLVAASRQGLRTGFVARPTEYGPHQSRDFKADHAFDVVARDFLHLAEQMAS